MYPIKSIEVATLRLPPMVLASSFTADHLVMEEIKARKLIPIFPSKDKVINQICLVELRDKDPTLTEREFQLFLEKKYGQKEVLKRGTIYYKHGFFLIVA